MIVSYLSAMNDSCFAPEKTKQSFSNAIFFPLISPFNTCL